MALHRLLNNFTGGQLSSQLDARVDLDKYDTGCRKLQNMRVLPWGGATFRAGTLFIAPARYSDRPCRLIPFKFSTTVNFVIEAGDLYMRFFKDGAQIMALGVPYTIVSPYTSAEVFEVQFKEINDVVYLVHQSHPPYKLSRLADNNWTLVAVAWKYPALLDENTDDTHTVTVAATTGTNIAITASAATFTADNVGSYFELRHIRDSSKVALDISVTTPGVSHSSAIKVKGDWTLVTTERWYGTLDIERSTDGGTVWQKVRSFTSASDRNVNATGTQEAEALFRLTFTCVGDPYGSPPWTGTAPTTFVAARASFEVGDAYIAGLVKITTYTNSTSAHCDIINDVEATTATSFWSEGAWSARRGYPRAVGLFEQRVYYGGTAFKPNTIWGSVAADFDNFTFGEVDDAAVAYQFAAAQQNPIQWLESLLRLHAGTSGGEHIIASGNLDEPLTPSNVTVRDPTAYGSEHLQALKIGNALLFVQRQGQRIRETREMGIYESPEATQSPDLTLLADPAEGQNIVQMDFARLPDPQVFAILDGGHLAVMTYNKEQNINAWSYYATNGAFESVACVYGSPADVVYVSVLRGLGANTVRYIEVFTAPQSYLPLGVFMDSAVQYNGAPTLTIAGLDHLEGVTVAVLADGSPIGNAFDGSSNPPVVSGGQITLPTAASIVNVGLAYSGELKAMKLDSVIANGTSQGRRRRISELCIRFRETVGCKVGNANRQAPELGQFAQDIPFATTSDLMNNPVPTFSGDVAVNWEVGPDLNSDIVVTQTQPLPMTVLGLFGKMEVFGE